MAKTTKKQSQGAPEWMVTYGDMVTLLLTFFVMLLSMANFEIVEDRFTAAIESIREALGMSGQIGQRVDASVDFHSLIHKLESIVPPQKPKNRGDSSEEGIYGDNFRLRRIRDGLEITLGGPILFEPFSDKITDEGKQALEQIGNNLMGHRNKVEVRGHAADEPCPSDWTDKDAMRLSFARAEHVTDELVERGVDPRTIRIMAVGANEPVVLKAYDPAKRGDNRRVEIIIRESLIDDYIGQKPVRELPFSQPADDSPETQPAVGLPATQPADVLSS